MDRWLLGLWLIIGGVGLGLAIVGPAELEHRAVSAVEREQDLLAHQGAERIGGFLVQLDERLSDPMTRLQLAGDLEAGLGKLVRPSDRVRGVILFIHDAEGRVIAVDPDLPQPMRAGLSGHIHAPSEGRFTDGPGVCEMCLEKMDMVSMEVGLGNTGFLVANVKAPKLASATLHGLFPEGSGGARLLAGEEVLHEEGAWGSDAHVSWADVPQSPWRVGVQVPAARAAPGVRRDATLLLLVALGLVGVASVGGWVTVRRIGELNAVRLDAALALAEEQKLATVGLLSAGIAHEIKNALAGAMGLVELSRESASGEGREDLDLALRSLEHLDRLCRDLTAFSRTDSESDESSLFSVGDAVSEAVRVGSTQVPGDRIRWVGQGAEIEVRGSRGMVVQIVLNLVINAVHAMEGRRGTVDVSVHRDAQRVLVWVDDAGAGVPAGLEERIFEPLFTTKARGQGTGLGLWLSRRLARDLGGDLTVERSDAGGARFVLVLPAAELAPPALDG